MSVLSVHHTNRPTNVILTPYVVRLQFTREYQGLKTPEKNSPADHRPSCLQHKTNAESKHTTKNTQLTAKRNTPLVHRLNLETKLFLKKLISKALKRIVTTQIQGVNFK